MLTYPANFPCPSRSQGHSVAIASGVVRTPMEAGNTRQRRSQRVMPHVISLTFMVEQAAIGDWLTWANLYAWDQFFTIPAPGLVASRAGKKVAPTLVRFMSDLQMQLMAVHRLWYWSIRVDAEYLPTQEDLHPMLWIIGGAPGDDDTLTRPNYIAGTPANPSTPDWILAGTPAFPSAAQF